MRCEHNDGVAIDRAALHALLDVALDRICSDLQDGRGGVVLQHMGGTDVSILIFAGHSCTLPPRVIAHACVELASQLSEILTDSPSVKTPGLSHEQSMQLLREKLEPKPPSEN
jgi:hypothetical protein